MREEKMEAKMKMIAKDYVEKKICGKFIRRSKRKL